MKIEIEIDEIELRKIVIEKIQSLVEVEIKNTDVNIVVKSKNNYKSEWENAAFKATVCINR